MKKIITLLFCLALSATYAQTIENIGPIQYNTIYEEGNLSNGSGFFFFAGNNNGSSSRRGLLEFDLSVIPPGSTITNVTLTMLMSRTTSPHGATSVSIHNVLEPWGQGTSAASGNEGGGDTSAVNDASWNCSFNNGAGGCLTAWTAGGNYDPAAVASELIDGVGTYVWPSSASMVSTVQDWLDGALDNNGWILIGNEALNRTSKRFNAIGDDAPVLEVTFTAPLSVEKNDFPDLIPTYANPTSGSATIQFEKTYNEIQVTVSDMSGRVVSRTTETSVKTLNIPLEGTAGMYIAELRSNEGQRAVIKLIKR